MQRRISNSNLLVALGLTLALTLGLACSDDDVVDKDGGTKEAGGDAIKPDAKPLPKKKVIILHTNDLHDHLQGWAPNADYTPEKTGDDKTIGGFARLATAIAKEKKDAGKTPVLTLDGGDFLMGSLFTWLNTTEVPTMMLMQKMGYDAIALGNHEFDWTSDGLAQILTAAGKKGFKVPLLCSNIKFDAKDTGDDNLEKVAKAGGIKSKFVKELSNGLKVGFFGILGKSAAGVAPAAAPVTFDAAKTVATKMVKELRETDKVDLVVALSHSGVTDGGKAGDDWQMAYDVAGIDVIVSGHTHTQLDKPLRVKNKSTNKETLIVQAGAYSAYLGKLELTVQGKTVTVDKYTLVPLDDKIAGDTATQTAIKAYIQGLNGVLKAAGSALTYSSPVAETAFDLTFPAYKETILGNIVADSYRAVLTVANPLEPVDVAIESGGVIRDEVLKGSTGKLWFADVYRALPLGIGMDKKPGYPMVTFYLTGKELKEGMELLYLGKHIYKTNDYYLQISGAQVTYDSKGKLFKTVTSLKVGKPGSMTEVSDAKCYKVATNYYVGTLLGTLSTATSGVLKVTPKGKDCKTTITDMKTRVVKDKNGQEIKAWQALLSYLSNFTDTNSNKIPDVPAVYGKAQGRIVEK